MAFKTKQTNKKMEFETGMQREISAGKPRYDLITPVGMKDHLLKRWAELMERGAQKYCEDEYIPVTKNLLFNRICDIMGLCKNKYCVNIKIELYTAMNCVGLVTKNNYERRTQILLKDSSKTELNGEEENRISKKLKSQIKKDKLTHIVFNEIKEQNFYIPLKLEDLQKKQVVFFWKNKIINAEYANEALGKSNNILTMTITRDSQEVTYVVGATTDLECLETILSDLKMQFNTYKILQPILFSVKNNILYNHIIKTRNWEVAKTEKELDRFRESAFRHFMQVMDGETDEDHYAAVCFNLQGMLLVLSRLDKSKK